jgi:hypothetical protein
MHVKALPESETERRADQFSQTAVREVVENQENLSIFQQSMTI